jgi:hypothetical protein
MATNDASQAYTILEFCERYRISRPFYYKLKNLGAAPRETRLGNRVLITPEAAAAWLREREAIGKTITSKPGLVA